VPRVARLSHPRGTAKPGGNARRRAHLGFLPSIEVG
jgi:hypothetical protein